MRAHPDQTALLAQQGASQPGFQSPIGDLMCSKLIFIALQLELNLPNVSWIGIVYGSTDSLLLWLVLLTVGLNWINWDQQY